MQRVGRSRPRLGRGCLKGQCRIRFSLGRAASGIMGQGRFLSQKGLSMNVSALFDSDHFHRWHWRCVGRTGLENDSICPNHIEAIQERSFLGRSKVIWPNRSVGRLTDVEDCVCCGRAIFKSRNLVAQEAVNQRCLAMLPLQRTVQILLRRRTWQ